ncbi:hypothetical protein AXG93_3964s1110 [Marchantia polymorpha subsp. ruderalis]|uniref:Uncharacterized protein n=1 Tax=Marchantia polymorpha subsp. ruderalis TaxID=1480154 RepID=A0A176WAU2_MARPO|nr:hypothetical protein AXG93_3964s1110 [Marchantia polymorpha subsp. ruderalis]
MIRNRTKLKRAVAVKREWESATALVREREAQLREKETKCKVLQQNLEKESGRCAELEEACRGLRISNENVQKVTVDLVARLEKSREAYEAASKRAERLIITAEKREKMHIEELAKLEARRAEEARIAEELRGKLADTKTAEEDLRRKISEIEAKYEMEFRRAEELSASLSAGNQKHEEELVDWAKKLADCESAKSSEVECRLKVSDRSARYLRREEKKENPEDPQERDQRKGKGKGKRPIPLLPVIAPPQTRRPANFPSTHEAYVRKKLASIPIDAHLLPLDELTAVEDPTSPQLYSLPLFGIPDDARVFHMLLDLPTEDTARVQTVVQNYKDLFANSRHHLFGPRPYSGIRILCDTIDEVITSAEAFETSTLNKRPKGRVPDERKSKSSRRKRRAASPSSSESFASSESSESEDSSSSEDERKPKKESKKKNRRMAAPEKGTTSIVSKVDALVKDFADLKVHVVGSRDKRKFLTGARPNL